MKKIYIYIILIVLFSFSVNAISWLEINNMRSDYVRALTPPINENWKYGCYVQSNSTYGLGVWIPADILYRCNNYFPGQYYPNVADVPYANAGINPVEHITFIPLQNGATQGDAVIFYNFTTSGNYSILGTYNMSNTASSGVIFRIKLNGMNSTNGTVLHYNLDTTPTMANKKNYSINMIFNAGDNITWEANSYGNGANDVFYINASIMVLVEDEFLINFSNESSLNNSVSNNTIIIGYDLNFTNSSNLLNVTLYLYNESGLFNQEFNNTSSFNWYNIGLSNGTYYINITAFVNDTFSVSTDTRTVYIANDTTVYIPPVNETALNNIQLTEIKTIVNNILGIVLLLLIIIIYLLFKISKRE